MRTFLAVITSAALCGATVYAAPPGDVRQAHIRYEENVEHTAQGEPELSAQSAVLMEASTGKLIYDRGMDERLPPASVTKIMTMLLIFDALDAGKIALSDEVSVSEYAASMGGSQVFLEPGETQSVETMLKCIAVASANDACVAMSEYISGSEEAFVARMNERAVGLGMENTQFLNCNGLDADGHLTTAHDIALMSRELITKYPKIHDYSMIWMENITHKTSKGTSEFGLTNTNKLVRHYQYATGLKTGSTSKAKFCVSATAEKDGIELIAVIMAAPDSKARVKDAAALLNYGFGKCAKYTDSAKERPKAAKLARGVEETVGVVPERQFTYVDTTGANLSEVKREVRMKKKITAPVKKGEVLGALVYTLDGKEIGTVSLLAESRVDRMTYRSTLGEVAQTFLL